MSYMPRITQQQYYTSMRNWSWTGNFYFEPDGTEWHLMKDEDGNEAIMFEKPMFGWKVKDLVNRNDNFFEED